MRPFPTQTVRDVIGIARLLYRTWKGHGIAGDKRLPELVAVGGRASSFANSSTWLPARFLLVMHAALGRAMQRTGNSDPTEASTAPDSYSVYVYASPQEALPSALRRELMTAQRTWPAWGR
ncbi:MAG: hypothetical protein EOO73_36415 [Myxococcales bacterium]|nr:MAG: hypothetical protein EOO73_36415 [Myxococcales bacterium]